MKQFITHTAHRTKSGTTENDAALFKRLQQLETVGWCINTSMNIAYMVATYLDNDACYKTGLSWLIRCKHCLHTVEWGWCMFVFWPGFHHHNWLCKLPNLSMKCNHHQLECTFVSERKQLVYRRKAEAYILNQTPLLYANIKYVSVRSTLLKYRSNKRVRAVMWTIAYTNPSTQSSNDDDENINYMH